jgi:hypothetical protein
MTVLDLLSAMGSFPASGESSFKEAVQAITGQKNVFSHRRFMEGLGHACHDRDANRIHVLAPRLVSLPCEEKAFCIAVLAGARNADLLSELDYLANARGVTIEHMSLGESLPERITLKGTAESLRYIARNCSSLPLEIANDPSTPDAWRMLSSVPTLQSIIRGVTIETTGISRGEPHESAEVFNPETGFYDRWSKLRENYRSSYILVKKSVYDYRLAWMLSPEEGEATWIQRLSPLDLDPFWARWAIAYSADSANALPSITGQGPYKVRRITPLPLELHRVCCLCSGYPPEERDGFYEYSNVPPVIQQGVNDRLKVDKP